MKTKYNFVLIFRDGVVPELPESKRRICIQESEQGYKNAIGSWNEEDIKDLEYYDANSE